MDTRIRSLVAAAVALAVVGPLAGPAASVSPDVPSPRGVAPGTPRQEAVAAPAVDLPPHVPGRLIVRLRPGVRDLAAGTRRALGSRRVRALSTLPRTRIVETDLSVAAAIAVARRDPSVVDAEPDYYLEATATPSDPLLGEQWGLAGPDVGGVDALTAWEASPSRPSSLVAVIDTGIDLDHPDLIGAIHSNLAEVPGNGRDDDANGFVDDVHGWDFLDGDSDPTDESGHGSHVSGIIAATGNNEIGVAGVAWRARILPVRILDGMGRGSTSGALQAFDYAIRMRASIVNVSWRAGGPSRALADAIAVAGRHDQVVVAAAGNDGQDIDLDPSYPASIPSPSLITVAASGPSGERAPFSNVGAGAVDLAAPGASIVSTDHHGGYLAMDGTSMAAPHVAGIAALLRSARPDLGAVAVHDAIVRSARPSPSWRGVVGSGGIADAARTLAGVTDRPPVVTIRGPGTGPVVPGETVTLTASALDPEDGDLGPLVRWASSTLGDLGTSARVTVVVPVGRHVVTATVTDSGDSTVTAALRLVGGPRTERVLDESMPNSPSVVVTPAGTPVVSYVDHARGARVATRGSAGWRTTGATTGYLNRGADLVLSSAGSPELVVARRWSSVETYADPSLLHVRVVDGAWRSDRITHHGDATYEGWPRAVRDANGHLHVAAVRTTYGQPGAAIVYGTDRSGVWVFQEVTGRDATDAQPDILVMPDGTPQLVFTRYGTGRGIWHARPTRTGWSVTRLTSDARDQNAALAATGGTLHVFIARFGVGVVSRRLASGTWSAAERVAEGHVSGVDAATGPDGRVHAVATFGTPTGSAGPLKVMTRTATGWEVTAASRIPGTEARIAAGPSGRLHVAYSAGWPDLGVHLATFTDGSWTSERVAAEIGLGGSGSRATTGFTVDRTGGRHLAVPVSTGPFGYRYARQTSAGWRVEVHESGRFVERVALAVDAWGAAHVAYVAHPWPHVPGRPGRVYYATNRSGSWRSRPLGGSAVPYDVAISVDRWGRPHILAQLGDDLTPPELKPGLTYFRPGIGRWRETLVARGVRDGIAMAVDRDGSVHAATSYRPGDGTVRIEYLSGADAGWRRSVITDGTRYDTFPSIALRAGVPWIAWTRIDGGVRVAHRTSEGWSTATISDDPLDIDASVAIAPGGGAHVAYSRASTDYDTCDGTLVCEASPGLRHAALIAGVWRVQRVTDHAEDGGAAMTAASDGSLQIGFRRASIGVFVVRLTRSTTSSDAGPRPPSVVSVTPGDSATDAPRDSLIRIHFSGPVTGVDARSVQLTRSGLAVAATVRYDGAGNVAELRPQELLAVGAIYRVHLRSSIVGSSGASLAPTTWTFTTARDGVAPTISARSPAPGAIGVRRDATVSFTFDEPVRGVGADDVRLIHVPTGAVVEAGVSYDGSRRTVRVDPAGTLAPASAYRVSVAGGISDEAGNPFPATSWSFRSGG